MNKNIWISVRGVLGELLLKQEEVNRSIYSLKNMIERDLEKRNEGDLQASLNAYAYFIEDIAKEFMDLAIEARKRRIQVNNIRGQAAEPAVYIFTTNSTDEKILAKALASNGFAHDEIEDIISALEKAKIQSRKGH